MVLILAVKSNHIPAIDIIPTIIPINVFISCLNRLIISDGSSLEFKLFCVNSWLLEIYHKNLC